MFPASLIDSPGGSPDAENTTGGFDGESLTWAWTSTGLPPTVVWLVGEVTESVPCQYQVKVTARWAPVPGFVAVTVTWLVPTAAGAVPVICPVFASMARPAGSPAAE